MTEENKRPKHWRSSTDMRAPVCQKQIACDGTNLTPKSRERGYCGRCREAMERRAKRGTK
jgi:hypothetical protein